MATEGAAHQGPGAINISWRQACLGVVQARASPARVVSCIAMWDGFQTRSSGLDIDVIDASKIVEDVYWELR